MPGETYKVQPLLSALSAVLGQTVGLDDAGECSLEFEGGVDLTIACNTDADQLSVRCALTAPMDELSPHTLRTMLAVNYAHLPPGHVVALDEASGCLALLAVLQPDLVGPDDFVAMLAGFVALVPQLRAQLDAAPARATQSMPQMGAWA